MEWPNTLEMTLDGMAQGGEAVGRWEGRVVFVQGGLPGERVQVALHERHDSFARGVITDLLEASSDRLPPQMASDHMPWQHIAYPAQLRFKQQILNDQLAKIGGLDDLPMREIIAAPRPWHYRNSARFHVAHGQIGYHAAGSRDLQAIESDPLLLPVLNDALTALRLVGADHLDEVVLRASETHGYGVAALRGTTNLQSLARRWQNQCPPLAGVMLPGTRNSVRAVEEANGTSFLLQPTTFFQVNLAAAETLLRLVRQGLADQQRGRLLDLYCGVGAFALPLAAAGAEVLGVEEFAGAVEDGRLSATENGITSVEFVIGPVERVLPTRDQAVDAVVLDPPRRGCHPEVLKELLRIEARRMVYVSCHPATLARDLKTLVGGGYQLVDVQPVDLFPQTPHIEAVCTLVRG